MTRGDKSAYTDKQKRKAAHIYQSEREQGRPKADAERIAQGLSTSRTAAASGPAPAAGAVGPPERRRDKRLPRANPAGLGNNRRIPPRSRP